MPEIKKGFLAIERGDYQEAINIFKRLIEYKKEPKDSFKGLGIALMKLNDTKSARLAFHKCLEYGEDREAIEYLKEIEYKESISIVLKEKSESRFRTRGDLIEINMESEWKRLFIKGINIGLGLPGYFPGEFAIGKATYLKWFELIHDAGFNAIRIYTIHPPCFYEALSEFNRSGGELYLFQGIWAELPEDNNFYDIEYMNSIWSEIKNAVDVINGNTKLLERPGKAYGEYRYNVSKYLIGYIFGMEWEACAVKGFNKLQENKKRDYTGEFLSLKDGEPFEVWITEICDLLLRYEYEKYGITHPVSTVNWPTLDPLIHPSESNYEDELRRQGIEIRTDICNENEDEVSLDVSKIKSKKGNGFFATYHVYPYYPDFMNNDYHDKEEPYLSYLIELKGHHKDQPVIIGEFGVPSSRDMAHWHVKGFHHGKHNEKEQGDIDIILMESIRSSDMAGGILFSLFDEWYKRNWLSSKYIVVDRNHLWFNIQDPEQNYGIIGMYPGYPEKSISLSGKIEEWSDGTVLYEKDNSFLIKDERNLSLALKRLIVKNDEGFIYLCIETMDKINLSENIYLIGIDTCSPQEGEFIIPYGLNITSPTGLKFLIEISGNDKSRILVTRHYDRKLNEDRGIIRPIESYQGEWAIIQHITNRRRLSKDGMRVFPSKVTTSGNLRFGSLDKGNRDYDSISDLYYSGNILELRIPWGILNFTDPSSHLVLWKEGDQIHKKTEGIRFLVISFKRDKDSLLFDRDTGLIDSLPYPLKRANIKTYRWEGWNTPIYHSYLKDSYFILKDYLAGLRE